MGTQTTTVRRRFGFGFVLPLAMAWIAACGGGGGGGTPDAAAELGADVGSEPDASPDTSGPPDASLADESVRPDQGTDPDGTPLPDQAGTSDGVPDDAGALPDLVGPGDAAPPDGTPADASGGTDAHPDGAPPDGTQPLDGGAPDGTSLDGGGDAPCVPDCAGRGCGSDGCGGLCGTCEPSADPCLDTVCTDGVCTNPPLPDGTACDADGDACTVDDACLAGMCVAGAPVDCAPPAEPECQENRCNPVSGGCELRSIREGEGCDDGAGVCAAGACVRPAVTFVAVDAAVFVPRCGACHTGPLSTPPVNYPRFVSRYAETQLPSSRGGTVAERIVHRAATVDTMPPSGPLSAAEQALVQQWLSDGALP